MYQRFNWINATKILNAIQNGNESVWIGVKLMSELKNSSTKLIIIHIELPQWVITNSENVRVHMCICLCVYEWHRNVNDDREKKKKKSKQSDDMCRIQDRNVKMNGANFIRSNILVTQNHNFIYLHSSNSRSQREIATTEMHSESNNSILE